MEETHYCPNCGEQWGFEEISVQECFSCDYPYPDDDYVCNFCGRITCICEEDSFEDYDMFETEIA
jgi:hypothetical protein